MRKLVVGCIICLAGCTVPKDNTVTEIDSKPLTYADKFRFEKDAVVVNEPWPGAKRPVRYVLADAPERVVVTSTTHLPYLEMLGVADKLVGFPSTQYISSGTIRQRVEDGLITDLGPDGSLNLELLISLQPDAVIAFDMGSESATLDKVSEAGIPVYYNADFLESSALGRAEWIKFFGALFQKEAKADSIFTAIAQRYDSLRSLTLDVEHHPTVLSGVMYGDVWFMPGGQNWSAAFYQDAGGQYLWENDTTSGWLELSFESVYEKGNQADFWIGTSTFNTMNELANQDDRYTAFKAFQTGNVYNYNKRIGPAGGYDFFESAYARPDRVLADLISILHPELMPDYETYYFQKLP